jgi:hypothetical protein
MTENQTRTKFLGTYFDASIVFRLVQGIQIAAWVILALYALEFLVNIAVYVLQILRGFLLLGPTDYASQVIFFLKQPLAGVIFFFLLQAAAQGLLILLDIEANSRRAGK